MAGNEKSIYAVGRNEDNNNKNVHTMNTLQQIIKEMKDEKSRALKEASYWGKASNAIMCSKYIGSQEALDLFIPKLELLLSEGATEGVDKEGKEDSSPMA